MWTRFWLPIFLAAVATPCCADDKAIANIADGIMSYRLSATYCHWPIPPRINSVLESDGAHFSAKNPDIFKSGVAAATARFRLLVRSQVDYCKEVKDSRDIMTKSLEERAK